MESNVKSAVFDHFSLPWALAAAHRLPPVEETGGYAPVAVHRLLIAQYLDLSGCGTGARALEHAGFSSCGSQALEHGLGDCEARVSLPCGSGISLDQGSNQCPLQKGQMRIHEYRDNMPGICFSSPWMLTSNSSTAQSLKPSSDLPDQQVSPGGDYDRKSILGIETRPYLVSHHQEFAETRWQSWA
ncbi:hypothetical protein MJG53_016601 [Ovis ammon polii x Ovis aries]|uniref:Uncharacterized protein n=1 Tax=Ovis ammon polii x Ovis aries TaxID=2918886 RepID=A0ACB9U914_9CETA|nr:hypothetical protein MJG53_016601 [Ovis ammon polii x Ovis aries]